MTEVTKDLMLFSGRSNIGLAEKIAEIIQVELGNIKIETFANGEIYARYKQSIRGSDMFILQSIASFEGGSVNDALMEMLIMVDAAKRASAHSITAVITNFGYARQDKKSAAREPITAKLVADMLVAAGVTRVITIDLHQGQIQGFFNIPVNHLTALPIFASYFSNLSLTNLCVVSPDVGRAKAAKKLAELLNSDLASRASMEMSLHEKASLPNIDLAIMHKSRPEHNRAEISNVIGDVSGKTCIINDDIIDTAGSIQATVAALKEAGAGDVYVCATHALFSGPAYERLEAADVKEVVVCDTVPIPLERQTGKIKVVSVARLLGQAISNVFNEVSVSELFDPDFAL